MGIDRQRARAVSAATPMPRRRKARASDWSVVLGAGLGALVVPLLMAVPPLLEGRAEELPTPALVLAPALGIALGGAVLVPCLRWSRRRLSGLPEGFVILLASGAGLGALLVASAAVAALAGGDGWSTLVLGGAAMLPLGLALAVGAVFFQALAESPRWLVGGWIALAIVVLGAVLVPLL